MKKQAWLPLLAGSGLLLMVNDGLHAFITNQSADVVIGHHYFSQNGNNRNDPEKNSQWAPEAAYYDGTRLYIADCQNNRVLIYNSLPATFDAAADVVIGQPDMFCNKANQSGDPGPNTLSFPSGIYVYGSILLISDFGNNRVLIFNTIPTQNNASANLVIGQQDFTHNTYNQGGTTAANTLDSPRGICSSGSMLFVADAGNNRVLKYNTIPTFNNINADYVIGQPNKTSHGANNPSLGANSLYGPHGIWVTGTKLCVSDYYNSRVLIYNNVDSISDGISADIVIGQPDFTHNQYNQGLSACTSQTLNWPAGVGSSGDQLFIADSDNHRVLIYNNLSALPSANASASCVIGQADMGDSEANQGSDHPASWTLCDVQNVFAAGSRLFISDTANHRVLFYYAIPGLDSRPADMMIGQQDMTHGHSNRWGVSEKSLSQPFRVSKLGDKYCVSDTGNNRILVYNSMPSAGEEAKASLVIGQADMQSCDADRGGYTVTGNTCSYPRGLCQMAGKLIAADTGSNRVLIYDLAALDANPIASLALGQPDLTSSYANQGGTAGPQTLYNPAGVASSGSQLFVADTSNHRVLVYSSLPVASNASADIVIGQPSMTSNTSNCGGIGAHTLNQPRAVAITADSRMLITDAGNNRVLLFNSIPTANNAAADVIIGQADITSHLGNQGNAYAGANTLYAPDGISVFEQMLCIADTTNNRVLIYNNIPTANNAAADVVIGQATMSGRGDNQNSWPHPNTLRAPQDVFCDSSGLFVSDTGNHRVVAFLNTPTPTPVAPTPTATQDIAYKNEIKAFNSRFNPEKSQKTYIRWHQAETARTTVKVFNLRGELVRILMDSKICDAGRLHEVVWSGINTGGSTVASGIYIIYIEAGRYQDKVKVAVVK